MGGARRRRTGRSPDAVASMGMAECALELPEGQALRMAILAWWVGAGGTAGWLGWAHPAESQGGDSQGVFPAGTSSSMCRARPCRQLICTFFMSKAQQCVKSKPFAVPPA